MMNDIAGILESGIPPDWFPSDKQRDFKGKRRDLLSIMPMDDLLFDVEQIIEMHCEHFADPNYGIHEYRPAQANGNCDLIGHACAILARYLYAASLGEKEGLPLVLELRGDIAKSATIGINNRRAQSEKAKNPRGKVGDEDGSDAFEILLSTLAKQKDALGKYTPASDLWGELYSKLEDAGAAPKLVRNNSKPRKQRYNYKANGKEKHITQGRFETRIGEYRKKLSR